MTHLGFQYNKRRKSYFTDRHESEENRNYRREFIQKYFQYELNSYLWIQLEESVAKKLEKDEDLLENIYYEYTRTMVRQ